MPSTRAPANPFAANSLKAACRIRSCVRSGFRVPGCGDSEREVKVFKVFFNLRDNKRCQVTVKLLNGPASGSAGIPAGEFLVFGTPEGCRGAPRPRGRAHLGASCQHPPNCKKLLPIGTLRLRGKGTEKVLNARLARALSCCRVNAAFLSQW